MRNQIGEIVPEIRSLRNKVRYGGFFLWRFYQRYQKYPELNQQAKISFDPKRVVYYLPVPIQRAVNEVPVRGGNWDRFAKPIAQTDISDKKSGIEPNEPLEVAIGRKGELLLTKGMQSLAQAKQNDIKTVTANVVLRHSQWQQLRKELFSQTNERSQYQPSLHPDMYFQSNSYQRCFEYCQQRFEIIKQHLGESNGALLDIGADLGFFSQKFEQLGFECYAIESMPRHAYYLRKLRNIENKKFSVILKDALSFNEKIDFNVVLALNIFHHFVQTKRSTEALQKLLRRLHTQEMFIQIPINNEPVMRNAYLPYDEDSFAEFILKNSTLNRSEIIGTALDGRKILKLSRD